MVRAPFSEVRHCTAILRTPGVERRVADPVLAAQLHRRNAGLMFLQHVDLSPSCCFTESMSPSTQRLVILLSSIAKKAAPDHEISRPEGATPKNWPRCIPTNRIRAA